MGRDLAGALAESVLPAEERLQFLSLCVGRSAEELARDAEGVASYVRYIERRSAADPTIDADLARRVGSVLASLLDGAGDRPFEERRLLAGAAAYFVLDHDAADDIGDIHGIDDDARVVRALCHALGRDDLAHAL